MYVFLRNTYIYSSRVNNKNKNMKHLLYVSLASLYNDAPEHYQLSFQDAASSLGEEII